MSDPKLLTRKTLDIQSDLRFTASKKGLSSDPIERQMDAVLWSRDNVATLMLEAANALESYAAREKALLALCDDYDPRTNGIGDYRAAVENLVSKIRAILEKP